MPNLDNSLSYTALMHMWPGFEQLDMRAAEPLINRLADAMTAANPKDRWEFARAWMDAERAGRDGHTCHLGAVCAVMDTYLWDGYDDAAGPQPCQHRSCGELANEWCQACMADAHEPSDAITCRLHGYTTVTDEGTTRGFAGGAIYWAKLACGCGLVDESDDVRAAR